jgi:hypothetical protein
MWNKDPTIRKMEKHIEYVSMVNNKTGELAGTWNNGKAKVKLYDRQHLTPEEMNLIVAHEISGHTYWHWAIKWRNEALVEFNELANSLPPANPYIEEHEEEWKIWNDDQDEIKKIREQQKELHDNDYEEYNILEDKIKEIDDDPAHQSMTRYANEQHSAMTELKYGEGEQEWLYYLNDEEIEALSDAWDKLHS